MGESIRRLFEFVSSWLESIGLAGPFGQILHIAILMVLLLLIGFVLDRLTRGIIMSLVHRFVRKTSTHYDDILLEKGVFRRLAHLLPALVVFSMIPYVFDGIYHEIEDETLLKVIAGWKELFRDLVSVYMIVIGLMVLISSLNAINEIYNQSAFSGRVPIKGYIQVLQILLVIIGFVWILSIFFNFHLKGFFTGLGAFMAVLVLVFRDTLLGLVASIQLSINKMIRIGDWVTIPSRNIDGVIMDISVNTVKVENFDKTITTVPTYALVSEPVQNWRGMEESNGRRIKRFVNIDISTVRFCTEEDLDRFEKISLISGHLKEKRTEMKEINRTKGIDTTVPANGEKLTNLGIFRKYLESYLRSHPAINQEMAFMVRQLQPTDRGVPMEVYVFCSDKAWEHYEVIQSDLFDHILAVMNEFDLRVFQGATSQDIRIVTPKP